MVKNQSYLFNQRELLRKVTFTLYFSLEFKKSEIIYTSSRFVNHIEFDQFRNDGSLLIAEDTQLLNIADGKVTEIVASGFQDISDFRQLNTSSVVVVEYLGSCLKVFDRVDKSAKVFAGLCGSFGFADGLLFLPNNLEFDEKNPERLLITENGNNALRSVDVTNDIVSTVISTGFRSPSGLAWYNGRLLVSNYGYISEVVWHPNGAVTNIKLTTATGTGYRDGDFSIAKFTYLAEITQITPEYFLIADKKNYKLRLLDMAKRKVLPVCRASAASCTGGTTVVSSPTSLLISNGTVYVGGYKKIVKLTG